jgi:hypothetical protein
MALAYIMLDMSNLTTFLSQVYDLKLFKKQKREKGLHATYIHQVFFSCVYKSHQSNDRL